MRCSDWISYRLITLLCLHFLVAAAGHAETGRAYLNVHLDAQGRASIHLSLANEPPDEDATLTALTTAIGLPLKDVTYVSGEPWGVTAQAQVVRRRELVATGRMNLAALAAAPKDTGIGTLVATVSVPHIGFARCSLSNPSWSRSSRVSFSGTVRRTDRPVSVAFGYTPLQILTLLWPFALALMAPVAITLRMRRATLCSGSSDPVKQWFGYWRFLQTLGTVTWIAWYAIFLTLPITHLLNYLAPLPKGGTMILDIGILIIPPILVTLLCQAMSNDVFTRLRGSLWTAADMRRQIVSNVIARVLPLVLILVSVGGLMDENARQIALGLILAFITRIAGLRALARARDMNLHALTVGPLRDRVFALAERAEVELEQLYVLPAGKSRVVNAFAVSGPAMILSEELVSGSSLREVDAIVGHELSHMRKANSKRRAGLEKSLLVTLLVCIAGAAVAALSEAVPDIDRFRGLLPLCLALVIGVFTVFSHRRERAADAGSGEITGDPEAMISALARLSRMNQMPVQWSRWQGRFISHPSTVRRAEALAARFDIPDERVAALLDPPIDPGETYPVPARSELDERIFSTSFKDGSSARSMWTQLAVTILVPSIAGSIVQRSGLIGNAMWTVYGAGLVLTPIAWLAAYNWLSTLGYPGLRDKLAAKLEAEGIRPGELGGVFVSFAPNESPRVYEGFHSWDIGFVIMTDARLCYVGEQARFALTREQVTSMALHPGSASWLRYPYVQVRWRDGEREGAFLLHSPLGRRRQMARETRNLLDRAVQWHTGGGVGPTDPLPPLEAPDLGEVTSRDPESGSLAASAIWMGLFGAGGACLFALSFDPPAFAGWYVVAVATFTGVLVIFPSRRRWRRRKAARPIPDSQIPSPKT